MKVPKAEKDFASFSGHVDLLKKVQKTQKRAEKHVQKET
jgi:hypothetical protein